MTSHNTTRPLVVLDCDSTTIQDEVIDLLAEAAGTSALVSRVTEQAMRGEIDFAESLKQRVATLAGTPVSVFEQTIQRVRLSPGIRELIAEVHRLGGKVGIVSGGFHEVLDAIATDLGVDFWRANRLEVRDGKLTGKTIGEIVDAGVKADTLISWAAQEGFSPSETVAIGDGANDLQMMSKAALSIAYNAKPIVQESADVSISDDLALAIAHIRKLDN